MAKIRFGYSDDFTAKNSKVGINTTEPQTNLDVVGVVKGQDLRVTGVSLQTGYEGFLRADHQIEEETQLNFGQGINASLSGEIIVGTGQTVTVTENLKEDRFGPELITNGQFLSNVDNWTATDSTVTWENGQMKVQRTAGGGLTVNQAFTTVAGQRYTISGTINSSTSRGDLRVYNGSGTGGSLLVNLSGTNGSVTDLTGSFTATSTTSTVVIAIDTNNRVVYVDNVVVRQEDAPRDYSADIKGSGSNKTLTAAGSAGVGYELGNYYGSALTFDGSGDLLTLTNNTDFHLGSGDYTIECWINIFKSSNSFRIRNISP